MLLHIIIVLGVLVVCYVLLSFCAVMLFQFFNGIRNKMVDYVNKQNIKYGSWKLIFYMIFCFLLMIGNNAIAIQIAKAPILNEPIVRLLGVVLILIPLGRLFVKSKVHFPMVFVVKVVGLPIDLITMALYFMAHLLGQETDEPAKDIIASERQRLEEEEKRLREYYEKHPMQHANGRMGIQTYEVTVDGKTFQTYDNPDFNSRIHFDGEGFVEQVGGSEYSSSS